MPHVSGGGGGRSGRLVYGPWARPGVGGKFYAGSRIHLNDPNDGTDRYLGSASLAKTNKNSSFFIGLYFILLLFREALNYRAKSFSIFIFFSPTLPL